MKMPRLSMNCGCAYHILPSSFRFDGCNFDVQVHINELHAWPWLYFLKNMQKQTTVLGYKSCFCHISPPPNSLIHQPRKQKKSSIEETYLTYAFYYSPSQSPNWQFKHPPITRYSSPSLLFLQISFKIGTHSRSSKLETKWTPDQMLPTQDITQITDILVES